MSLSEPTDSSTRETPSSFDVFSNSPRARRFSTSSPSTNGAALPRLTPRISQLLQEECLDAALCREAAHEKEIHSAIAISQSWEDLTIEASINLSMSNTMTGTPTAPIPMATVRQCYSPAWKNTLSPSPTRKAFATRRSLSPIAIRPSCLGSVKRKFELDDVMADGRPQAKRTCSLPISSSTRRETASSPQTSSAGTPEPVGTPDSPNFSFRPLDSPSNLSVESSEANSVRQSMDQASGGNEEHG